jgi:peptidoglycan/LPS O-acetylase OafA/YrhL
LPDGLSDGALGRVKSLVPLLEVWVQPDVRSNSLSNSYGLKEWGMSLPAGTAADERFLPSGDEIGTAPDDRRFRPDVEGLRALAVLLVVLYHGKFLGITGGYVGVDVFFVISGFVITGLLIRERSSTKRTSLLGFYARRVRRILPAATLVILATVFSSYIFLGNVLANGVANDGRWAAVFVSNFHFESIGTSYLTAHLPPSPLQNYWSLSVEEQFYLVFPTLFLLVARARGTLSLQKRMTVVLIAVIVLSLGLSVVQTASSPAAAYFSPFTRAWELALGGLIAVSTSLLRKFPIGLANVMTWAGLGMILLAAFSFDDLTPYPGSAVVVPVVGAGLTIAGGVVARGRGAELVLGTQPFQWLGRRSYGWYLVHWPILIIATESQRNLLLPGWEKALLMVGALGVAGILFRLIEDPVRHLQTPKIQTVVVGGVTVFATVVVLSVVVAMNSVGYRNYPVVPAANLASVTRELVAASSITNVPHTLVPSVDQASSDWGGNFESTMCISGVEELTSHICVLGDTHAEKLVVALGDSHVLMWLPALDWIAKKDHLRLVVLSHWFCPTVVVTIQNPPGSGSVGRAYTACNKWRQWAIHWVNRNRPSVLLVSNEDLYQTPAHSSTAPSFFSADAWQSGMTKLLEQIQVPGLRKVILGNIPVLSQVASVCLSNHVGNVQACSAPAAAATLSFRQSEQNAAASTGAEYIDTTPWFCSSRCNAIVKNYIVYMDQFHVTATYGRHLERVLGAALKL